MIRDKRTKINCNNCNNKSRLYLVTQQFIERNKFHIIKTLSSKQCRIRNVLCHNYKVMMTECKVPVFVSPQSLTFSLEDKSSHRQIITLFNPYDFPVRFKVFCTCTKKYTVVEPEGSINPSSRVDIVVRHNAPAPAFCDIRDKFRIQMQYYTTKKVIGHKDVETILVRSSDNFEIPADNFKQLLRNEASVDNFDNESEIRPNYNKNTSGPNITILCTAIICICGLFLPSSEDTDILKFTISYSLKLALAFVLGMTTITIFQHQ